MQGGAKNQKEPTRHLQECVKSSEKVPEFQGGVFVAVGGSLDLEEVLNSHKTWYN